MQFSLRKLIFLYLLFPQVVFSTETKITWRNLKLIESKMEKWVQTVTEKDLILIGKMKQRPEEVEFIRAFFPYLLPQKFLTYHMDMECYPAFKKFKEKNTSENYQKWDQCIEVLYRDEPPRLIKKALQDLKP